MTFDARRSAEDLDMRFRASEWAKEVADFVSQQLKNVDQQFGLVQKFRNVSADFQRNWPTVWCTSHTQIGYHFPAFVEELSNGPNFVTNISVLSLLFLICSCNLSFVVNLNGLILFCKCVILHVSIDEAPMVCKIWTLFTPLLVSPIYSLWIEHPKIY